MTVVRATACNRDCPDACSLLVTVDAEGRALSLRGDRADPVTRGFLCERTGRFLARQQADDRITSPMLRRGGRLVPVSWDVALDVAAERLLAVRAEFGPAAILHYRSGGSLGILKALSDVLFAHFGPVTGKTGDICSGAGEAAQERDFGVCDSHDLFDLDNSRTILLWGKNPHTSGVHLLPVLRAARARGAVLVGIDPVRTRLAEMCDLFVQPRPGSDASLAFGVARVLIESGRTDPRAAERCEHLDEFMGMVMARSVDAWAAECDVSVEDIRRMAEHTAAGPTALLVGWGLGRRRNGSATVRALDALVALSGNLGVAGGGASFSFRRRGSFDLGFLDALPPAPRNVRETCLGADVLALRDPPIRAAWITAGNPASMLPDAATVRRALAGTGFTVVVDTHPTDTTDVADLVLPTLTLLEDSDIIGSYGNHWVRESRAAVPPPGFEVTAEDHTADARAPRFAERFVGAPGPRHELEIWQGLAARLGCADALAGDLFTWKERVTRSLAARGAGRDAMPVRDPARPAVLFADGRCVTPTGRVELLREPVGEAVRPTRERPLLLLAVSTPRGQSSQWSVPQDGSPPPVNVHPDAAGDFADGAPARLESAHGALDVVVRHDRAVRPDVALMEKGGMLRSGGCVNDLVAACETDAGGGAAYYDEPVRLVPR